MSAQNPPIKPVPMAPIKQGTRPVPTGLDSIRRRIDFN